HLRHLRLLVGHQPAVGGIQAQRTAIAMRRIPWSRLPSPEFYGALVIVLNDPRCVAHIDRNRHHFHQPAKAIFNLPSNFLGPLWLGNVAHYTSSKRQTLCVLYTVMASTKKPLGSPRVFLRRESALHRMALHALV